MALPPLPISPNYSFGYLDDTLFVRAADGPGEEIRLAPGESYAWDDEGLRYSLTFVERRTDEELLERYRRGPMMVGRSPHSGIFELAVEPGAAVRERGVRAEVRTVQIGS